MDIAFWGKSDKDNWPKFNLGFSPNTPSVTTPQKGKAFREQAPKANMPTALVPPPPEKQNVPREGTTFPAEPAGLLLDLGPSTTQEPSWENGNGYMKDLELLIPEHNTFLLGDASDALDHPISLSLDTNQASPKTPANRFGSGGRKLNCESDLIDFTPESAALGLSVPISSLSPIENTVRGNSKNLGRFQEEVDGSDIEESGPTLEPIPEPKKSRKHMSERRLQRQGDFSKWAYEKAKEINLQHRLEKKEIIEERMSLKSIVSKSENVISDPREYQLELFEIAKTKNTIAVLDTGSGKTLIACLLIRHVIEKELESRAAGNHPRVSFFLVHNVALAFQQAAVLRCNIDARIGEYCGDMGAGDWEKETWDGVLKEQQVIVMTADILYSCLVHAFIKIQDINLLCFDEAHHAKKRHSFARIIKDFYLAEPENARPKIFGMTASPVGSRADVVHAATDLEKLLHSQIATTSDLALLRGSVSRPEEVVTAYPTLKPKFKTDLCQKLHKAYGELDCFSKIFAFVELAASELGPWCADIVWKFALSETHTRKLERRTERKLEAQSDMDVIARIEKEILYLQEAADIVRKYKIPPPSANENYLSAKVLLLHAYLKEIYSVKTKDKCIIFVSRRYTATVLADLFKRLEIEHLQIGVLVGSIPRAGATELSFREQMITVSKFRQGKLNCLIATSVAEEGLDIPDCSLVIRFDLYHTMIQYVQSRGRARSSVSKYIHMLESGNRSHLEMLKDARNSEKIMRDFCCSLPADRILDSASPEESSVLGNLEELYHIEPGTGAKLTMTSSMTILSRYTQRLPQEDNEPLQPLFTVRYVPEGFISEVTLPILSAIQHIEGAPMPTKTAAKRSASFMACLELRRKGELDENLMPKSRSKRCPKMANAHLALDIHNSNVYPRRAKPDFWKINTPLLELWFNILLLSNPAGMASEIQPICLITRNKLPPIPAFTVYSDKGAESELIILQLSKSLRASPDILKKLCQFTHRLFLDLFNKTFELTLDTVPYWMAPIKSSNFTKDSLPENTLDWKLLEEVSSGVGILWDDNYPVEKLIGRFLIDRRQRSRRFIILDYHPTLKSTDPYPPSYECPPGITDIQDYSYNAASKRKWSGVKWKVPGSEPVLIAERLLHRIDYLSAPDSKWVTADNRALISPSAFSISDIPSKVIHMAMIFPSFITRIDSYLHAWEVCGLLGMQIDLGVALEAITKDSDNTHDHGSAQVSFQRGMGANYERLEFLGDCFLKLATSLGLYIGHHGDDEFELHVKRMVLVCNKYLFSRAKEMNIPEYIQTAGFSRRTWYPEMKLLIGKGTAQHNAPKEPTSHRLADKSISDVCEALIGAALIDKGLDGATQMVTTILRTPEHTQKVWADYYNCYTRPAYQLLEPSPAQVKFVTDIEELVKYKFKHPRLLISAFTHPSFPFSWDRIPSYQRLEFLGDAILDLVCVRYIFQKYPHADPQWLTEHKMAMVSNKFLAMVSVEMGFHRKLKRIGASLDHAIRDYEVDIQEARANSNGAMDFWTSLKSPPKALSDVLEAFIGAVFVDSGFQYSIIEGLINTFILPYFVDMTVFDNFAAQHPTAYITRRMADLRCESWGFESQQCTTGNMTYILTAIVVHSEIFSYGSGVSVKAARVEASLAATKKLEEPEGLKQLKDICNCMEVREERNKEKEENKKIN